MTKNGDEYRAELESVPESSIDKVVTGKEFSFKMGTE